MKRSPALEPFSRDHNRGLILARALMLGHAQAVRAFEQAWDQELLDHFEEEERLLGPLANPDQADQMRVEHSLIRSLKQGLPESSVQLGETLEAHIRWEERELFPAIEASLSDEEAVLLLHSTMEVEVRRWPHDARRQTLVLRRLSGAMTESNERT